MPITLIGLGRKKAISVASKDPVGRIDAWGEGGGGGEIEQRPATERP
jgi:hypothetical protein